jgi:benzoyl-CoA 2,3-dioxygenase component B
MTWRGEVLSRHRPRGAAGAPFGRSHKPRILGTFDEPITDWLSFFMFTYFTDRDGRFQLKSLAESAFDPLSRTCRFMLIEEAFHMFIGGSGIT